MAILTAPDVLKLALSAGIPPERARLAVAVAYKESSFNTEALGPPTKYGRAVGLWQIMPGWGRPPAAQLRDPKVNAEQMVKISGAGSNWSPWEVCNGPKCENLRNFAPPGFERQAPGIGLDDIPVIGGPLDATRDAAVKASQLAKIAGDAIGTLSDPEWWKRLGVGAAGVLVLVVAGVLLLRSLVVDTAGKVVGAAVKGATE